MAVGVWIKEVSTSGLSRMSVTRANPDCAITPCDCQPNSFPFACQRHGCDKTEHWWKLCRERPEYFAIWERKLGPGQVLPASGESTSGDARPPSMAARLWSLSRALVEFVFDGCETVTADQYEDRLRLCDSCGERQEDQCGACGCLLSIKAKGRVWTCPLGKWPRIESSG